jgi:CDP-diacylglycerol---serine O-phosphatidyltransferase
MRRINNCFGGFLLENRKIISFVNDAANIVSLIGLFFSTLGIYCVLTNYFRLAMICVLWSIFFDWTDGVVARKNCNRTQEQKRFGKELDSLIDIISFGVFPALFLLSYVKYNVYFIPLAFLVLATAAIRLSFFNIFGLSDSEHYIGLALDNNLLLLALIFVFEMIVPAFVTTISLCGILIILMILNLSSLKVKKLSGKWYYVLITFNSILTVVYFYQFCVKHSLI